MLLARFGHGILIGVVAFILVGIVESWLNFKIA